MPPRKPRAPVPDKPARKRRKRPYLGGDPALEVDLLDDPGRPPLEFRRWLETRRSDVRGLGELAPAVVDAIVGAVAACGSLQVAAGLGGVDLDTVRRWMDKGHSEQERRMVARRLGQDPGPEGEHERLLREVLAAMGWWAGDLVAVVQRDAHDHKSPTRVKSAQWLLARVGPRIAAPMVTIDETGRATGRAGEGQSEDRQAEFLAKIAQITQRKAALRSGDLGGDGEDDED